MPDVTSEEVHMTVVHSQGYIARVADRRHDEAPELWDSIRAKGCLWMLLSPEEQAAAQSALEREPDYAIVTLPLPREKPESKEPPQ